MSYEYKGTIQDSIIHYYDHVLLYNEYTDDVLDELDHVYRQATKADEYEAKAKAFDAYHSIIAKHIEQQYSHNKHDMVNRFVKIHDEYESGGYDD